MDIEIKISDDGFQAKHRLTDIPYKGPGPTGRRAGSCLQQLLPLSTTEMCSHNSLPHMTVDLVKYI